MWMQAVGRPKRGSADWVAWASYGVGPGVPQGTGEPGPSSSAREFVGSRVEGRLAQKVPLDLTYLYSEAAPDLLFSLLDVMLWAD